MTRIPTAPKVDFDSSVKIEINEFEEPFFAQRPSRYKLYLFNINYTTNIIDIKEKTMYEYVEKLEELQTDFKYKCGNLNNFKSTLTYFMNPFIYDITENGFPVYKITCRKSGPKKIRY